MLIRSFSDKDTEVLFNDRFVKRLSSIANVARRKLYMLNAAVSLMSLSAIPGNRLEKLSGDRAGQYSIRINDQFRICFRWDGGDAFDVAITDYH